MGGTSCDVCVVDGGAVQEQSAGEVADRPLALPMLAVHTVGAGGGSIAWRDPGGALRVGPRSAVWPVSGKPMPLNESPTKNRPAGALGTTVELTSAA